MKSPSNSIPQILTVKLVHCLRNVTLRSLSTGAGLCLMLATTGPASAQTNFTVLKLFREPVGLVPAGPPAAGQDGTLYGVTAAGGSSNLGTVFKLQRDGSHYETLKSFAGGDGQTPFQALTISTNGTLFGTTYGGGQFTYGTVFKLQKDGSGFQVLHHFSGGSDSKNPSSPLIEGKDGALYGMTSFGDTTTRGTVYKINKDGTGYTILHSFTGSPDGQQPQGRLLQISTGAIYGTAFYGGASTQPGMVFCLNPDGSGYWIVHTFGGAGDGRSPNTGLTEGSDGSLYGTTGQGGSASGGTLFRMDKFGGNYSILHNFLSTGGDGKGPNSELVEGVGGMLYGTTSQGGQYGSGTVFRLAKDGSGYIVLHHFSSVGNDLSHPWGLLRGSDGIIYGATQYGGGEGAGCIYALTTAPLPARILSLSLDGNSARIQCATTSAVQYEVQLSTNLTSWAGLGLVTTPPNGELSYTNVHGGAPIRFYRLKEP